MLSKGWFPSGKNTRGLGCGKERVWHFHVQTEHFWHLPWVLWLTLGVLVKAEEPGSTIGHHYVFFWGGENYEIFWPRLLYTGYTRLQYWFLPVYQGGIRVMWFLGQSSGSQRKSSTGPVDPTEGSSKKDRLTEAGQ